MVIILRFIMAAMRKFDNMATFLNKNQVDELNDEKVIPGRICQAAGAKWIFVGI